MKAHSVAGFTLLEVVVALAILAGVLVSLPGLLLQAEEAAGLARRTVLASVLAAEKLEQLRGLAWAYDPAGSFVEDRQSDLSVAPIAPTGGGGLRPAAGDSLATDLPGFVDYLDADGRWLPPAAGRTPGPAFVRRWSVDAPREGPADTLLLRVRVLWVSRASGGAPALVEIARLATLKSRRPR